ncbi:NADH:flavin oxidoreductase/NADH oxidase [Shewanella halifaxensis HAW-EB4]|uniref:NADH:flavin oxidoreductase/NADH oxidase n=1 Tax=Shewanella halifaxensis (strain HAW-EB4) TaxID=458817 RepID=B0TTU5_SHEHH|nr:alkene reductase [Shewanella halifaxensis]ABZ76663.1 NADH:flavin oxidoreductase/NADH oxidase [Shewanella halifaxensis HAW-EB4]
MINNQCIQAKQKLLSPLKLGEIILNNRVVMAPMTRNRANSDGTPTQSMVQHYADRASAGLIVAEGTWPSHSGQAYSRQPGIETKAHCQAWRHVTDAVHAKGGKIVLQIMHSGRIGSKHIKGEAVNSVAPSAIQAAGQVYTDSAGMQDFDMPLALSSVQIAKVIAEHRQAAINAIEAGFDGVELHCTSGYLPMQFLCSGTNQRTDKYGGSSDKRASFAYECLLSMSDAIGAGRVGLRINPGNSFNDCSDDDPAQSHISLLKQVKSLNLAYLHVMKSPLTDIDAFALAREHFNGPLILNDGFEPSSAAQAVQDEQGQAVSFARHFIANPDLVYRINDDLPLSKFDRKSLYTAGDAGYNDYQSHQIITTS